MTTTTTSPVLYFKELFEALAEDDYFIYVYPKGRERSGRPEYLILGGVTKAVAIDAFKATVKSLVETYPRRKYGTVHLMRKTPPLHTNRGFIQSEPVAQWNKCQDNTNFPQFDASYYYDCDQARFHLKQAPKGGANRDFVQLAICKAHKPL